MSDRAPETPEILNEAKLNGEINPSRRKLAGAALGATAVFTLASRPVWGGQCSSPSGFISGNLSQHGTPIMCSGRSPGYWKNHPEAWPAGYLPGTAINPGTAKKSGAASKGNGYKNQPENWSGGTLFHPTFSSGTGPNKAFFADLDKNPNTPKTSLSMMQIMQMNDGNNPWGLTDNANLGSHIVAALLNAATVPNLTPVLSVTAVIGMWNEWVSKGYFEPTANVRWDAATIVTYIKSTFT